MKSKKQTKPSDSSDRLVGHIKNPMPASGKGKPGEKSVGKYRTK